jgi:hypothetical protein
MKNKFYFLSFLLVSFFFFGLVNQCLAITIPNPIEAGTIPELIKAIADLIFWIALAIVPLMIIIGGIMFLLAAGEPQKVSKAKSLLFWSATGLAILLLARALSAVIETVIGGA